ncbi:hypothetical protein QOT17_002654 [Balamuthia mandrillaris]
MEKETKELVGLQRQNWAYYEGRFRQRRVRLKLIYGLSTSSLELLKGNLNQLANHQRLHPNVVPILGMAQRPSPSEEDEEEEEEEGHGEETEKAQQKTKWPFLCSPPEDEDREEEKRGCNVWRWWEGGRSSGREVVSVVWDTMTPPSDPLPLEAVLHNRGYMLDCRHIVTMAYDIASAVAFLHSLGIIHGTLSSRCCEVWSDGARTETKGASNVRVFDYGLRDRLCLPYRSPSTTFSAWPPEVLLQQNDEDNNNTPALLSEKTDCFAFGMLLYQLMCRSVELPPRRKRDGYQFLPSGFLPQTDPLHTSSPVMNFWQSEQEANVQRTFLSKLPFEVMLKVLDYVSWKEHPFASDLPMDLVQLLWECCHQEPEQRPSFATIVERLEAIKEDFTNDPSFDYVYAGLLQPQKEEPQHPQRASLGLSRSSSRRPAVNNVQKNSFSFLFRSFFLWIKQSNNNCFGNECN